MTSLGRYWLGIRKILNRDFGQRARFHLKSRSYVLMLLIIESVESLQCLISLIFL